MELPDDVLQLIRALSLPRMRFYKEYRQGLTELGFKTQEHWFELRDKLCTSDAAVVFEAFLVYKEATLALKQFHKGEWPGPYSVYFDSLGKLILNQSKAEGQIDRALAMGSCVKIDS
jgi:hypothetical protein